MMSDGNHDSDDGFAADTQAAEISTNKRVPVALVLDTSGSMSGAPISQLNEALESFQKSFDVSQGGDPEAARSGEVALVTFGDGGVQAHNLLSGSGTVQDSSQAFVEGLQFRAPTLQAGGGTPMGEAMVLALQILEKRKEYYRTNQIPYWRPMLFLISDGAPNSGWESSAAEAKRQMEGKHVLIYPIGVAGADLNTLSKFSTLPAIQLAGLKFAELFQFISNSMAQVANTDPNAQQAAALAGGMDQWAQTTASD